jgi:peptidoglycan/LPS O-acetylase OafA/YrhL
MAPDLSRKIETLRGLALLLVVMAHARSPHFRFGGAEASLNDAPFLGLQDLISGGLAKAGVPLFAFISGFLFFRNAPTTAVTDWFLDKGRRRLRSLLVPYLAWSGLGLAFYWLLGQIPWTQPFVARQWVAYDHILDVAYHWLWLPVAYPLWFVRDLMLSLLLSPVLLWAIRRFGIIVPGLLLAVWLGSPWPVDPVRPWRDLRCLAFFTFGAWVAVGKATRPSSWQPFAPALAATWVLSAALNALLGGWDLATVFHTKLTILLGFAALWLGYDSWPGAAHLFTPLGKASFFIFAAHEPLLTATRKLWFLTAGYSAATVHVAYLLAPTIVVAALYLAAVRISRIAPGLDAVLTGRRLAASHRALEPAGTRTSRRIGPNPSPRVFPVSSLDV